MTPIAATLRRVTIAAFIGMLLAAPGLGAQDSTHAARTDSAARLDSLAERLARAEAAIRLLREQPQSQAAAAAGTKSRSPIEFSGRVLMNAFYNSGHSENADVPTFAVPAAAAFQDRSAGATFRQTQLALSAQGAKLWGADATGYLEVDFFGGAQAGAGGRLLFPEPRLRIARAMLTWGDAELMVGQDVPLLSPVEPTGLASTGKPSFAGAGNLWLWLPQVRLTKSIGESGPVRWALQGALVAPWGNGIIAGDADRTDIGERSRLPMLQARLRARWGEEEQRGEVGVSGHIGWLGTAGDSTLSTNAVAVSWIVPLASWLEARGEAYSGQMLAGLGGGGAGQNFGLNALSQPIPLRDTGGWLQVNVRPNARWTMGGGCGQSQPLLADRPSTQRNVSCETHAIWRPGGLPVIGLELKEIQTTYATAGTVRTRQVNLAVGVEF